ncbi:hypothetical protein ABS767_10095 [Sphingomonas sp. ST-64]|uniref:Uncharacterized protein n=1 Tax=Sphingomonas plantiphila TaxID=3163295 RepID=A0ABW8YN24_9SPHN
MRRTIIVLAGIVAILIGLLWVAQGLDLLNWPPQSFMVADRQWALRGAVLAGVGAILVAAMRRR